MGTPDRIASRSLFIAFALLLPSIAGAQVSFRGRVVDQDDKPVASAQITANAPAMGPLLATSAVGRLEATSDSLGEFSLTTPFPQLLFQFSASKVGYTTESSDTPTWVPDQPGELTLRLRRNQVNSPGPVDARIRGRIVDGSAPVPNLKVVLRDVRAQLSLSTTTAADGTFVFNEVPAWISRAILEAETDEKVLPLGNVASGGAVTTLALVRAGMIFGTLTDELNGDPLVGAEISIRPRTTNRLIRTVMSDENGTWSVTQVPPGDYIVSVNSPTHIFSTRATSARGRVTSVTAGGVVVSAATRGSTLTSQPGNITVISDRVARTQIAARRKAIISGKVVDLLGNPVADARVGAYDTWDNDNLTDVRVVHTDAEGKFTMETGRGGSSIQVVAFDYALGYATTIADALVPGERRGGLQIQLSGAARISGTLLDPAGRGIEGITVTPAWSSYGGRTRTDARGHFDLGLVSIGNPNGNYELRLTSPKPRSGRSIDPLTGNIVTNPSVDEARTYYPDSVTALNAPPLPGDKVDLKTTVAPSDLLIFRGRVLDAAGKPVAGASIQIFAGKIDPKTLIPTMSAAGDLILSDVDAQVGLSVAQSAPDGSYTIYALRSDGADTEQGTQFSIGATTTSGARVAGLSQDALVPLGTTRSTVDITVTPVQQPAGGTVRVR